MRERPILFSGPMVRAILEGRKFQTRRAVKPRGGGRLGVRPDATARELRAGEWCFGVDCPRGWSSLGSGFACPYGKPGDTLWVREAWLERLDHVRGAVDLNAIRYTADGEPPEPHRWRKRSPIHMPRWASRITLEVTGVRVERLHSITEKDARAEGVENDMLSGRYGWKNYGDTETAGDSCDYFVDARDSFRSLWESINGADSWAANPWVWVVSFVVKK